MSQPNQSTFRMNYDTNRMKRVQLFGMDDWLGWRVYRHFKDYDQWVYMGMQVRRSIGQLTLILFPIYLLDNEST